MSHDRCQNLPLENAGEICLAGGCFWGVQEYFSNLAGVLATVAGYANGTSPRTDYEAVCSGKTGHAEAVLVKYDPARISLRLLLQHYLGIVDPISVNRQGNDIGPQYRTGIYFTRPADRPVICDVLAQEQARYGRALAVECGPLETFCPAESYHQDYLKKNPDGYCHLPSGRSAFVPEKQLVDPNLYPVATDEELRKRLDPQAWDIIRHGATEAPYSSPVWNNKAPGIYVAAASGEPLFSSKDKYDSGTGWPSFRRPIEQHVLRGRVDTSHGMSRIEVLSRNGQFHLGHVFDDGPAGSRRYCINGAALRFIPLEEMESAGYGYLKNHVMP